MKTRYKPLNILDEKWEKIPSEYLVGSDGNIYHEVTYKDGTSYMYLLSSSYYRNKRYGYQQVRISCNKKKVSIKVHRAVALAFCPRMAGQTDVDHINNDKSDNRAVNLRWLTHADNVRMQRYRRKKEDEENTYKCPECGAVYDVRETSGHEGYDKEKDLPIYTHTCPCCGAEVFEGYGEPAKDDLAFDDEDYIDIEEENRRMYDRYVNDAVGALNDYMRLH